MLVLAWGGTQIAFGILALTWPDVTVLVLATLLPRSLPAAVMSWTDAVLGGRDLPLDDCHR